MVHSDILTLAILKPWLVFGHDTGVKATIIAEQFIEIGTYRSHL